jgi:hypothetical protein
MKCLKQLWDWVKWFYFIVDNSIDWVFPLMWILFVLGIIAHRLISDWLIR